MDDQFTGFAHLQCTVDQIGQHTTQTRGISDQCQALQLSILIAKAQALALRTRRQSTDRVTTDFLERVPTARGRFHRGVRLNLSGAGELGTQPALCGDVARTDDVAQLFTCLELGHGNFEWKLAAVMPLRHELLPPARCATT